MTKSELRKHLHKHLRQHGNKLEEQELLQGLLRRQLALYSPDLVLAFVPKIDEVNVWLILQMLSCRLSFVKIAGCELEFAPWHRSYGLLPDLEALRHSPTLWQKNSSWDIVEPRFPSVPNLSGEKVLLLCPGLGFFLENGQILRLGRGGGFYDRTIARLRSGKLQAWGLSYSVQWHSGLAAIHKPGQDQVLDGLFISGCFYAARS